jgi:hypothetical protein
MQTKITVSLSYDFRGESYNYQADIVLPLYIDNIEGFYRTIPQTIADKNKLNTFSYQYEVMESSPIEVIAMESRIEKSLPNLPMAVEDFLQHYSKVGSEAYLEMIANEYNVDLSANPRFAKALKAAYTLGKEHRIPEAKMSASDWMKHCFT